MQQATAARGPRWQEITRFYLPLALSDMVMALQAPIIASGVARLPGAQVNLAAYSAALSVALLIESPIIMLLQTATALGTTRRRFQAIRRLTLWISAVLTLLIAIMAWSPWAGVVLARWLSLPPEVARQTGRMLGFLLFWPAFIAWRRIHQGLLINHGHSRDVGLGSLGRLAALAAFTWVGTALGHDGAAVAGMALIGGVFCEMALIVVLSAVRLRRGQIWSGSRPQPPEEGAGAQLGMGQLLRFFLPLAATSFLMTVSRPLLTGGLARAPLPDVSLAVWPIVWTTAAFFGNGCRMLQQVAIVWVQEGRSYRAVRRFALAVATLMTLALAVLVYTPLGEVYLRQWLGLPGELWPAALTGIRGMALFPVLIALQNWYQAFLVKAGRTPSVHLAATVNTILLVVIMYGAASRVSTPGLYLAVGATLVGLAVEVLLLSRLSGRVRRQLSGDVPAGGHVDVEGSG